MFIIILSSINCTYPYIPLSEPSVALAFEGVNPLVKPHTNGSLGKHCTLEADNMAPSAQNMTDQSFPGRVVNTGHELEITQGAPSLKDSAVELYPLCRIDVGVADRRSPKIVITLRHP